jgi:hypothetical protein
VFVGRLVSIAVKVGLVAAVIVGGVYVFENRERIGEAVSGSGSAPIDYNCSLPGSGFPWLEQERGRDSWHGDLDAPYHLGGIFASTVPSASGDARYALALPVRIREDGTPSSMADVYRMLCALHPDLGGSGLRPLTPEEKRTLDFGDVSGAPDTWDAGQIPDLYTDGVTRAADEAHIGWERIRVYLLPPLPEGLRDALSTAVASRQAATPAGTPTPAPSGETRRYRVTVNGYENALPVNYPVTAETRGVRFDYRLIGEFVLERSTASKPWAVTSRRVVTADLRYSSLYPADRCQVTLQCENRYCRRLDEASTLRLRVTVDGDEIAVSWGAFVPSVLAAGTCTDASIVTGISYESDDFQTQIGGERLPLQDLYVGPQRIQRYQGRSDISTSFAYGLERLP